MGQNPVITPGEHQNSWDLWISLNIDLKWEAKFGHKGTPPLNRCVQKSPKVLIVESGEKELHSIIHNWVWINTY
jgi:hypothetical protein